MKSCAIAVNQIDVIGEIWQPGFTCALSRRLTQHDIECIGKLTRENIHKWIDSHFGDFCRIIDFRADIGGLTIDWQDEESEVIFNDCNYE